MCNSSIHYNLPLCVSKRIYLLNVVSTSPSIIATTSKTVSVLYILPSLCLSKINYNFSSWTGCCFSLSRAILKHFACVFDSSSIVDNLATMFVSMLELPLKKLSSFIFNVNKDIKLIIWKNQGGLLLPP